jgi:hypothetical protein
MATEGSSFNPVVVLVHLMAIAIGLLGGWIVMDRITPDGLASSAEPGVSSSSAPGAVAGDAPDSLLLAANLGPALSQLRDQLAAGEGVVTLHIAPGSISTDTSSADGTFGLDEVDPATPALIADQISEQRPKLTLADIGSMDLVATSQGPQWYVQVDPTVSDVRPPWTYRAPLAGTPLTVGGAPPQPIG